jgi:hypothetical protein
MTTSIRAGDSGEDDESKYNRVMRRRAVVVGCCAERINLPFAKCHEDGVSQRGRKEKMPCPSRSGTFLGILSLGVAGPSRAQRSSHEHVSTNRPAQSIEARVQTKTPCREVVDCGSLWLDQWKQQASRHIEDSHALPSDCGHMDWRNSRGHAPSQFMFARCCACRPKIQQEYIEQTARCVRPFSP